MPFNYKTIANTQTFSQYTDKMGLFLCCWFLGVGVICMWIHSGLYIVDIDIMIIKL